MQLSIQSCAHHPGAKLLRLAQEFCRDQLTGKI